MPTPGNHPRRPSVEFRGPHGGAASGIVEVPGSKSIAQRALVCALLADGCTELRRVPRSADFDALLAAVQSLGARTTVSGPGRLRVSGAQSLPHGDLTLDLGENGTALRFALALSALRSGKTRVRGAAHRPVRPLLEVLGSLGARIETKQPGEYIVHGRGALVGGAVSVDGSASSQFASALLLVGARMHSGLELSLTGKVVSSSYIEMTVAVLRAFGLEVTQEAAESYSIAAGQSLRATSLVIEPDLSAAAFYLAAASVTGGEVTVAGFEPTQGPIESLQGDLRVIEFLSRMGSECRGMDGGVVCRGAAQRPIEVSLRAAPDLLPPLAAVAVFVAGRSRFEGVGHLRHKESNRLEALAAGLRSLGVESQVSDDGFEVVGQRPERLHGAVVDAHGDHRIAMAFGLIGLRVPGVVIQGADSVRKSDPDFWVRLGSLLGDRNAWAGESCDGAVGVE